ncbi:MAG: hypothetical protein MJZ16_12785, partial [Bacteroidales bacterium]|nr:hypothetical protein [Bacteroidales bacterium]
PEQNNFELVYDSENDKYYAYVDALLYRDYGNYVCDILESRGNRTDVSMEILCEDVSYSISDKALVVNKMVASAVTLLGEMVQPGMEKAHATAFAKNDTDIQSQMIRIMQELKFALDNYTSTVNSVNNQKGGIKMNKLQELLEKYSVDLESLPFASEVENKTDEELEEMFDSYFSAEAEAEADSEQPAETNDVETFEEADAEDGAEDNAEEPEQAETFAQAANFSVKVGPDTYQVNVSLGEKVEAIHRLVNSTYSESDNEYYSVEVFDSHVVMIGIWGGVDYRQEYVMDDEGTITLSGDRIRVYRSWLTKEEMENLEKVKREHCTFVNEKAQAERDAVLNDANYSVLEDTDEWQELRKNCMNYSVSDLAVKADALYGQYCKSHKDISSSSIQISHNNPRKTPYGSLFNN